MHTVKEICYIDLEDGYESNNTGILFEEESIHIAFPRGFNLCLSERNIKSDILLLIKVFDKYNNKKNSILKNEENLNTGEGEKFSISNAIWLLNDYIENGFYWEYINNCKLSKHGNINWPNTIKKVLPHISNNKFIYLDYITNQKNNNIDNIIYTIQKYIISKSINIIGWLYPNIKLNKGYKLPFKHEICIGILNKELQITNSDKVKRLISHMIDFLKHDGNEINNNIFQEYKTQYFEYVWEDMLNFIIGNDYASNYYPNATWKINGVETAASNLRPDTILNLDSEIYIIDAKYYKYGATRLKSHLPQSSDIGKQLLYSNYISAKNNKLTYNAFIIPYKSKNNDIFEFIGTAGIPEINDNNIICILGDTKSIMQMYVSGNGLNKAKGMVVDIINNNK